MYQMYMERRYRAAGRQPSYPDHDLGRGEARSHARVATQLVAIRMRHDDTSQVRRMKHLKAAQDQGLLE